MGVPAIHHRVCICLYNSYRIQFGGTSKSSGPNKRFIYCVVAAVVFDVDFIGYITYLHTVTVTWNTFSPLLYLVHFITT